MTRGHRRKWLAALVVCGAGTAFQALPTGCNQYMASTAMAAFDFCAVFNCTGGTYFDLCAPFSILIDCPTNTTTETP